MSTRRSASLPMASAIERLRVEGSKPIFRPTGPYNTPMSLSENNLAEMIEPAAETFNNKETPLIPVISINRELKDITRQEMRSFHAGSSTVVQRMKHMTRVKQIADGYHPEQYEGFTEPIKKTGENEGHEFFLNGCSVSKDSDKIADGFANYRPIDLSNSVKAHPMVHQELQSGDHNHALTDVKEKTASKSARENKMESQDYTSKCIQLPLLTFGSPHITSACDYPITRSMPSDREELVSQNGSLYRSISDSPTRSTDMDFRLLKHRRLAAQKALGKEEYKDPRPYSSQELNYCLRINKTGNSRPSTGGESLKLRHNTQFMQRNELKISKNPYQNMLNQVKNYRKSHENNGYLFTSVDSYLNFNQNKKQGKMQPVLLKASGVAGQSCHNRAYTDTHVLRMIFEMNRPISRTASPVKHGDSEYMNRELGEYIRVNAPRLEPRTNLSRYGAKSSKCYITATAKENQDE